MKLSPQNQLDIYFLALWEYWLGLAKYKNVLGTLPLNSYQILKNSVFNVFFLLDNASRQA